LPFPEPDDPGALSTTQKIIAAQEGRVTTMASVLETLAGHYDNMANTLKEMDDGEVFGEEDWRSAFG
jgi:autophagy-related protein 17